MRFNDFGHLQVAGKIDRIHSKIIKRAHLPRTILNGCLIYVWDYQEYDDVLDSIYIDCEMTFRETNPRTLNQPTV